MAFRLAAPVLEKYLQEIINEFLCFYSLTIFMTLSPIYGGSLFMKCAFLRVFVWVVGISFSFFVQPVGSVGMRTSFHMFLTSFSFFFFGSNCVFE